MFDRNAVFLSGISDTRECARVEVAAVRLDGRGRADVSGGPDEFCLIFHASCRMLYMEAVYGNAASEGYG